MSIPQYRKKCFSSINLTNEILCISPRYSPKDQITLSELLLNLAQFFLASTMPNRRCFDADMFQLHAR